MLISKVYFYNKNKNIVKTEIIVIPNCDYTNILDAEEKIKEYAIERCKHYLDARYPDLREITFDYIIFEPDTIL